MDTTDTILGALAGSSMALCFLCILSFVCCKKRPALKPSRSDNELSTMIDQQESILQVTRVSS